MWESNIWGKDYWAYFFILYIKSYHILSNWFTSDGYRLFDIYRYIVTMPACTVHCALHMHWEPCQLWQRHGRWIINGSFLSTPCPIDVWDATAWESNIWSRDYWTDVTIPLLSREYFSKTRSIYHDWVGVTKTTFYDFFCLSVLSNTDYLLNIDGKSPYTSNRAN